MPAHSAFEIAIETGNKDVGSTYDEDRQVITRSLLTEVDAIGGGNCDNPEKGSHASISHH